MTNNDDRAQDGLVEALARVLREHTFDFSGSCIGGDWQNPDPASDAKGLAEHQAQALLPTVRELQAEVLEKAADDCRDVFLMRTTAPTSWTTNAADAIEQILRAEAATYRSPQATTGGANND